MEFRITVLLFIAVMMNIVIDISESMDEAAAKERIKNNIKKIMEKGIKVDQHHFNELADKEVLRAEMKAHRTGSRAGSVCWVTDKWCSEHGLYAYGPVYNRIRSHGATDLLSHKKEIASAVSSREFPNEENKQQYIDELARQKTAELLEQERECLIKDGYSPKMISRLLEQRGLLDERGVYEELRQLSKPIPAQSMDLQLSKDRIQDRIKQMKRHQRSVSKYEYHALAVQERNRLEDEYRAIAEKEFPKNEDTVEMVSSALGARGIMWFGLRPCIVRELEKPPSVLDEEKSVTRKGRSFERGEGSSSRP